MKKLYRLASLAGVLACLGGTAAAQPVAAPPCQGPGGAGACLEQVSALMARQTPMTRMPARRQHPSKPAVIAEAGNDSSLHLRMSERLSRLE